MSLCASVYMCFVVTCWERAGLLALVCGVYCEFVTFPLVSWVRCGTWLYRFLIFASLLTLNEGFFFNKISLYPPEKSQKLWVSDPLKKSQSYQASIQNSEFDQKYHNHKPQKTPWHREEEPFNHHETPVRQIKQSNQLSLPNAGPSSDRQRNAI